MKAMTCGFHSCTSTRNTSSSIKWLSIMAAMWEQEFCGCGTNGGVLLFILPEGPKDPKNEASGPRLYDQNVFGT